MVDTSGTTYTNFLDQTPIISMDKKTPNKRR